MREARAARLDLRPLDDDGLRALVARATPCPPPTRRGWSPTCRRAREGNPFYAGELLRALEERRRYIAPARRLGAGRPRRRGRVPPLLRQVIDARVDRLGEEARDLLAVAAVIGQEVPLALWASGGAGPTRGRCSARCERAAEARLLAAAGWERRRASPTR